jgi:hypothetical protein
MDRRNGLIGNDRMCRVQSNVQPVDPFLVSEQAAVTEVKAQQIRICVTGNAGYALFKFEATGAPGEKALRLIPGSRELPREPGPEGPARDPRPTRDLAVVMALRMKLKHCFDFLRRSHERSPGLNAAGGIRTHKPLRGDRV